MTPLLQKGGPPGATYTCSDKGWITEDLFVEYLRHFSRFVKPSRDDPVLLVMDNHSTHSTLQAYDFCKKNGIVILTIPPHTSHRLQPLDVTFYSPLKTAFNSECNKYLKNHPHEKITPFEIAALFNQAYSRTATPEKAIKGFQVTGICPYNPDVFTDEDFGAAQLHENNSTEEVDHRTPERYPTPEPHQTGEHQQFLQSSETTTSHSSQHVNLETSFAEILPLPGPSTMNKGRRQASAKQHSQIVTSTPNKKKLEEKAKKKEQTPQARKKSYKRNVFADTNENQDILSESTSVGVGHRKSKRPQRKIYENLGSSEEDNDDECQDKNVNDIDICLVCGEFGKNGEMWLRCVMCGNWAHKACADIEKGAFICDYCR